MVHTKLVSIAFLLVALCFDAHRVFADDVLSRSAAEELFGDRLAAVLKARCLACHGDGAEIKGGLDLRTRDSMLKGGDSTDALVPGEPALSLIYRAARYDDEIKMPPEEKAKDRLTELQLRWLEVWIAAGAPWPANLDMNKVIPSHKQDSINIGLPDYKRGLPAFQYQDKTISIPLATADEPKLAEWSAEKAVKYLDDGALAWTHQRKCIACHTNGAYMMTRPALTPYLGPPLAEVKDFFVQAGSKILDNPSAVPIFHIHVAISLAEWDANIDHKLSPETDRALRVICNTLVTKPGWKNHSPAWIPYIIDPFHDYAVFARAVGTAPGWLDKVRAENDTKVLEALDILRQRLKTEQPRNDFDRVHLLWSDLRWPGLIDESQRAEFLAMIGRHQRPDGGWSLRSFGASKSWGVGLRAVKLELENYGDNPPSDGHMTGLAIIVLREAGVAADDSRIRRGIDWLKTNQRESGRWWTRSLNTDFLHLSTYHGTAQALLALGMCGEIPLRAASTASGDERQEQK